MPILDMIFLNAGLERGLEAGSPGLGAGQVAVVGPVGLGGHGGEGQVGRMASAPKPTSTAKPCTSNTSSATTTSAVRPQRRSASAWWTAPSASSDGTGARSGTAVAVDDRVPAPSSTARSALGDQAVDGGAQALGPVGDGERGVEGTTGHGGGVSSSAGVDARRVHEERGQREQLGRLGRLGEQRLAGAEQGAQAHDQPLAQRVDGRVGDLGEALAQVVAAGRARGRQVGQGRVVAHREGGLVALGMAVRAHHRQVPPGVRPCMAWPGDQVVGHLERGLAAG